MNNQGILRVSFSPLRGELRGAFLLHLTDQGNKKQMTFDKN